MEHKYDTPFTSSAELIIDGIVFIALYNITESDLDLKKLSIDGGNLIELLLPSVIEEAENQIWQQVRG